MTGATIRVLPLLALLLLPACQEQRDMPKLVRAGLSTLQKAACPESKVGCPNVGGVYLGEVQTIVVPASWDRMDLYDRSVLLHEFVHHLQHLRGDAEKRCLGDLEAEAYEVQRAFLAANGVRDPLKMMGMDEFTLTVITMCRGW